MIPPTPRHRPVPAAALAPSRRPLAPQGGPTAMRAAALGALLALAPTAAPAFWDVQRSEEDVFGNVNVTATSYGDNGTIIRFECGSRAPPFVAFLIRDDSGDVPEIPAVFLMRDAEGTRHEAPAELSGWNDRYVAVRVTDPEMLRRLAELMVVAKRAIPVGIEVPLLGLRLSDTFSPRGSTAAGRTVLAHCLD